MKGEDHHHLPRLDHTSRAWEGGGPESFSGPLPGHVGERGVVDLMEDFFGGIANVLGARSLKHIHTGDVGCFLPL